MHFIVATTVLFAASAVAQFGRYGGGYRPLQWPDNDNDWPWGGGNRWGGKPNRWGGWGRQQPPTDYRVGCTCNTNQQEDPDVGRDACNQLASIWGNLYWDEWDQTCYDDNNVGLDVNGFGAACQRAAQNQNYDSWNPVNADANCSPH